MTADQTPTDQTPEGTDPAEGTPPAGTDQDQGKPASRQERRDQAARERAAELETERDKLAGRVEQLQRAEVERLAGEILAQPGDLLELGKVDLADLLDDEGNIDPDAVAKAAAGLVDQRPGLSVNAVIRGGHKDWGHTRTGDNDLYGIGSEKTSWSDAFGAAGRGNGMHYT